MIRRLPEQTLTHQERKKNTENNHKGRARWSFNKNSSEADALGNVIRFILTSGERNDITQAKALIENLFPNYVIADKDYVCERF